MDPDQFIRKICHDLRAPLRAMKELPHWLAEDIARTYDGVDGDIHELIDMITLQAGRMDRMIDSLGYYARLERTEADPSCPVEPLLRDVAWAQRVRIKTTSSRLAMERVHADDVIGHLISNAFKHGAGERGGVALLIADTDTGSVIQVSDEGPSVPPEHRASVFDPLTTLKPRDDCEGSGMGLAIIARIAEMYGGTCNVHDGASGNGAVFQFCLPMNACPPLRTKGARASA
ncbi:MAG: HAMP domain-containing sensor histidine kinase [Pseudomonadota bacterium]